MRKTRALIALTAVYMVGLGGYPAAVGQDFAAEERDLSTLFDGEKNDQAGATPVPAAPSSGQDNGKPDKPGPVKLDLKFEGGAGRTGTRDLSGSGGMMLQLGLRLGRLGTVGAEGGAIISSGRTIDSAGIKEHPIDHPHADPNQSGYYQTVIVKDRNRAGFQNVELPGVYYETPEIGRVTLTVGRRISHTWFHDSITEYSSEFARNCKGSIGQKDTNCFKWHRVRDFPATTIEGNQGSGWGHTVYVGGKIAVNDTNALGVTVGKSSFGFPEADEKNFRVTFTRSIK